MSHKQDRLAPDLFARYWREVRGPAWRSSLAAELGEEATQLPGASSDRWLHMFSMRPVGDAIAPGVADGPVERALALDHDASLADRARVAVLAGMPTEEIAERLDCPPDVVAAWEAGFFDVRGQPPVWLLGAVLTKTRGAGRTELAAQMQLALTGGTTAVKALWDADTTPLLGEADRLLRRKMKLELKFSEAVETPLKTEQGRLRFVEMYLKLDLEQRRLDLWERQLALRCESALTHAQRGRAAKAVPQPAEGGVSESCRAPSRRRVAESALTRLRWASSETGIAKNGALSVASPRAAVVAAPSAVQTSEPSANDRAEQSRSVRRPSKRRRLRKRVGTTV